VMDAFRAITGEAERASAVTCERCGEPGGLHETRYLVKTLCASCANSLGYTPVQQAAT
jgi:formylmethanofuran dehydrogenase subunit E